MKIHQEREVYLRLCERCPHHDLRALHTLNIWICMIYGYVFRYGFVCRYLCMYIYMNVHEEGDAHMRLRERCTHHGLQA